MNGDGFGDVIIGAPNSGLGGASTGGSYVMFGKASGSDAVTNLAYLDDGVAGFSITDEEAGYELGSSVSSVGDMNGDGFDDLIIAAPYGAKGGSSYILFGSSTIGQGGGGVEYRSSRAHPMVMFCAAPQPQKALKLETAMTY